MYYYDHRIQRVRNDHDDGRHEEPKQSVQLLRHVVPTLRSTRGAVVVETALTVGLGLTILLFAIQVGVLGFLQVTADAASFLTARNTGLGIASTTIDTAGAADFTHKQFNQIATTDIATPAASAAPSAPIAMNFEYNVGFLTNGQRHSGESMLQPLQISTTVKPHGMFSFIGQLVGVGAQDVEPEWIECTPHFNSAQNTYAQCGASGNPSTYATNYFTNGENTPMYFIGFNFMTQCTLPMPWTTCTQTPQYLSMGSAEYLDTSNWSAANPGVSGSNTYYSAGNGGKGVLPTYGFEYVGCHDNRYADIAFYFQHYPDLPSIYSGNSTGGGAEVPIAQWLSTHPTNFKNIASFAINPDPGMNASIQQVYSWDEVVQRGQSINSSEPGANSALISDQGQGC
jgi:hypothetical protein